MTPMSRNARTHRAARVIAAPPEKIYHAFIDPAALMRWLPPDGMRADLEAFDPQPGGRYRMVLSYLAPDHTVPGKTSVHSDVVEGKFLELIPNTQIVQEVRFESDDPAFEQPMRISWLLRPRPDGTEVVITCENVPDKIEHEHHDAGLRSSLANLARLTERPSGEV